MQETAINIPSSYRDPSGFVFTKNGTVYRQVNQVFREQFDHFIKSGCYDHLVKKNLLVSHTIVNDVTTGAGEPYLVLRPDQIPFISYTYEWCFSMLKDAALLTLDLLKEGLNYGVILKDATFFNIQWKDSKLVWIDTLSFEKYDETKPWIAYRQFCECFLGPLLISHYSKQDLCKILLAYPDGIPLGVIKSLLPKKSRFSLHIQLHIHFHHKMAVKSTGKVQVAKPFSRKKLLNIIRSLEELVESLKTPATKTVWGEYYEEAELRDSYLNEKSKLISSFCEVLTDVGTAIDIGGNRGEFSKILAQKGIQVVTTDADPLAISLLYDDVKNNKANHILPLLVDIANPSPAIGVNNTERSSFIERCNFDLVMALALIHHLCIGKNIPFSLVAEEFSKLGQYLLIEFVPKQDAKVQEMLAAKADIYNGYDQNGFESAFQEYYSILKQQTIGNTNRILYLMKKK